VVRDNRLNSRDSRSFFGGRGAGVPFASIKGRASVIWLPVARFWQPIHAPVLPEPADPAFKEALARCLANPPTADSGGDAR
jgi:signal peptidase I